VSELHEGGVYLNLGSAVVLPEVFLKAVSVVRNLGCPHENFTTVNLDFLRITATAQRGRAPAHALGGRRHRAHRPSRVAASAARGSLIERES